MHKWSVRILALVVPFILGACGERLEGGAACPVLCSGESLALKDTVLDAAIVIDTTLANFPPRGSADLLSIANSGDSVEVRYVVRFDTLPIRYVSVNDTLPITSVDSAHLRISIEEDLSHFSGPVVFEAYDVDTTAVDSVTSALLPLFRSTRLLGTVSVDSAALKDTVRVFLNNNAVAAKITTRQRLRIGVRVRSAQPVRITIHSANPGSPPLLRFDPAPADTAVDFITLGALSRTPAGEPRIALDFYDYTVVAGGEASLPSDVIGVGGPRGRHTYLRFELPARITDSTTVIRASLVLTQKPTPTYGFTDSVVVSPRVVVATNEVTDLYKAALILDTLTIPNAPPTNFQLPVRRMPPNAAVQRVFDVGSAVRAWRSTSTDPVPAALVLRPAIEARLLVEAQFYSTEAPANLRPKLIITYLPRNEFGIP